MRVKQNRIHYRVTRVVVFQLHLEKFLGANFKPTKCHCCLQIETCQLICSINQLTGFYMRATLAFNGLKMSQWRRWWHDPLHICHSVHANNLSKITFVAADTDTFVSPLYHYLLSDLDAWRPWRIMDAQGSSSRTILKHYESSFESNLWWQ